MAGDDTVVVQPHQLDDLANVGLCLDPACGQLRRVRIDRVGPYSPQLSELGARGLDVGRRAGSSPEQSSTFGLPVSMALKHADPVTGS